MGRIRTIKPDLFDSASLARVSRDTRYFFVGLFTLVDDDGRMKYLPKKIVGDLYPYDDDVTPAEIEQWTEALVREDCVRLYTVDDETYLHLPNWLEHQRIAHPTPSKYPDPDAQSLNCSGEAREPFRSDSGEVHELFRNHSGDARESFRPEEEVEVEGEGDMEVERASAKPPQRPKRKTQFPDGFELTDEMRSWPTALAVTKAGGDVDVEFENFRDWHTAKGNTFIDWKAAFRTWLRNYRPKRPVAPDPQVNRFAALLVQEANVTNILDASSSEGYGSDIG